MAPPSHLRLGTQPEQAARRAADGEPHRQPRRRRGGALRRARLADRDARAPGDRGRRGAALPRRSPARSSTSSRCPRAAGPTGSSRTRRASSCGRSIAPAFARTLVRTGPKLDYCLRDLDRVRPGPTVPPPALLRCLQPAFGHAPGDARDRRWGGRTSTRRPIPSNYIDVTGFDGLLRRRAPRRPRPPHLRVQREQQRRPRRSCACPFKPGPQHCPRAAPPAPPAPPAPRRRCSPRPRRRCPDGARARRQGGLRDGRDARDRPRASRCGWPTRAVAVGLCARDADAVAHGRGRAARARPGGPWRWPPTSPTRPRSARRSTRPRPRRRPRPRASPTPAGAAGGSSLEEASADGLAARRSRSTSPTPAVAAARGAAAPARPRRRRRAADRLGLGHEASAAGAVRGGQGGRDPPRAHAGARARPTGSASSAEPGLDPRRGRRLGGAPRRPSRRPSRTWVAREFPLGRLGTPKEVADVARLPARRARELGQRGERRRRRRAEPAGDGRVLGGRPRCLPRRAAFNCIIEGEAVPARAAVPGARRRTSVLPPPGGTTDVRRFTRPAARRAGPCRSPSSAARRRSRRCAGTCTARSARLTWSCSSRASASRGRVAVAQHDDRAHDRAALLVGRGDHRGLGHGRVGDERGLDLERADPVAGGDDHVVGAALEVQVAVLVACTRSPVARCRHAAVATSSAAGSRAASPR